MELVICDFSNVTIFLSKCAQIVKSVKSLPYINFRKGTLPLCHCCIHAPFPPIYVHICNIKHSIIPREEKHG